MSLKNEIQTKDGIVAISKRNVLPDGKKMSSNAFEAVEGALGISIEKKYVKKNFDKLLKQLLIEETQEFCKLQDTSLKNALNVYVENHRNTGTFTELDKVFDKVENIYNKTNSGQLEFNEFINEITKDLFDVFDYISFSGKQSAKSRVGQCLQNHLEKLFDIVDVNYDRQKTKRTDKEGAILDFIFPSEKAIDLMPTTVISLEVQTTTKDRFRLNLSKIKNARKYLATTSGLNLITSRDSSDLTFNKIWEIIGENNQVTLVVFDEVKKNILKNLDEEIKALEENKKTSKKSLDINTLKKIRLRSQMILSYSDFLKEVLKVQKDWNKLKRQKKL